MASTSSATAEAFRTANAQARTTTRRTEAPDSAQSATTTDETSGPERTATCTTVTHDDAPHRHRDLRSGDDTFARLTTRTSTATLVTGLTLTTDDDDSDDNACEGTTTGSTASDFDR